ncbi:cysteine hydrolase family protein [Variovorax sp. UMC13]|uniref:cysteine hydrolase family protein n=1 Tax=Variovorax sp. UMC13 TaxID=1862326 RepID=UPI0016044017|nr:isochorismatase family cysteine hydrolase [Variovorax sp. UMC13]MBB1600828.1 hypothetical protein [Variovorax sp. UMC13]
MTRPADPKPPDSLSSDRAAHGTALLIIDMISCWDFPDADALMHCAVAIAAPIAQLKSHCAAAGVPTIYCNDNRGRWRSDFRSLVDSALACGGKGGEIARRLAPGPEDYFVLKPMQSSFFETPLASLLKYLDVHRLILTGISSDQCVMASAMEAGLRALDVVVPQEAVASQTPERNEAALRQFRETHKLEVVSVRSLVRQLAVPKVRR